MLDTDRLEAILNRVHEWTRAADEKLNIMVAVQAIILATVLPKIETWWQVAGFWTKAGLGLSGTLLIAGLFYAILALFPRIKSPGPPLSVTFFGDIAATPLAAYRQRLQDMSDDGMSDDHLRQIHHSSKIAAIKFSRIRQAVIAFVAGVVVLGGLKIVHALQ